MYNSMEKIHALQEEEKYIQTEKSRFTTGRRMHAQKEGEKNMHSHGEGENIYRRSRNVKKTYIHTYNCKEKKYTCRTEKIIKITSAKRWSKLHLYIQ